jgi:hypothetical protein
MKNEVKKKMTITPLKQWHQSHRRKNFFDECQPFFCSKQLCDSEFQPIAALITTFESGFNTRVEFSRVKDRTPTSLLA